MDRNFLVAVLLVLYTLDQQENWCRRLGAGSMPANEDGMEMTNEQTIEKVADCHGVEDLTASKVDTKGVAIDGRRNSYTHAWQ
ncbi:Os07g0418550 [Oryza sativa Japonica Group]|nr:Os07g0418550 [Oryza sativa Japonica Group]